MTVEITFWTTFKQSFSWLRAVAMASILVAMAISVAKGHWELLLWQAVALMGVLTEWVMAAEIMAREIICDAQKTHIEALERTAIK